MALPVRGLADVACESVLVAGGGCAILLQLANPGVGHGVAEHSDFSARPLNRLTATLTYIYAVVYGTADELAFVRRRVNRAHARVHDDGTGDPAYDAYDPALQLWVAATLYRTATDLHERLFGPFEEAVGERIYQEYAALGTSLQMPAELWPADRTAFEHYWSQQLRTLWVDDAARTVATVLLHSRTMPWPLRPAMPLVRLVTAGLLDPPLRDQFGLPWSARRQRRFDRLIRFTGAAVPRLPARVRHALRDHYLRGLRREIRAEPARR